MIELSRLRGSERYAACSDEVLAHLPRGSAHTERIRLPYSVVKSGNPPAKKWKCSALSRNDCIIPVLYLPVVRGDQNGR